MPTPSSRPGMGARLHSEGTGTSFRVWAPFADSVAVAGSFNNWSDAAHQLASEGNGYWSADVPEARAGDEYRYVINGSHSRIDPRALAVTNSVGNGVIVDDRHEWEHQFQAPPWNEMVVYEMHTRTFPDKVPEKVALFDELLAPENVTYLRELGVNTLLIMPTAEFAGDVSWGYNPAHIFAIESSYGGPRKFKEFVDRAHANGFAVLLDVVYNHFGPSDIEHSVWQFDGWHEEWDGVTGGIFFYNDWRARTPWGTKNRPDYGRDDVRRFIRDNVLMWLEDYRVDGLRFDMTVFIRNVDGSDSDAPDDPRNLGGSGWTLLQWLNDEVDRSQPWKLTMAEDLQGNAWVTKETGAGGLGFDTQWDANFVHPVRSALVTPDDGARDMSAIRFAVEHRPNGNPWQRVIYTESHDEVAASNGKRRLPDDIHPGQADSWESKKRSTLGAALVFTCPGIPMIFQGQEMLEWIPFGDEPMDWTNYDRFRGIYHLYRDLIRLRRNWFDNTRGLRGDYVNVFHAGDDKVLAFHRWDQGGPGDDVVVVMNFSNRTYPSYTIGFPRAGGWRVRFNSDWSGYSPDFGNTSSYDTFADGAGLHTLPCSGNVGIGPYSAIILSQG
jgi:1,4-alpha-glucan branching enzyme